MILKSKMKESSSSIILNIKNVIPIYDIQNEEMNVKNLYMILKI